MSSIATNSQHQDLAYLSASTLAKWIRTGKTTSAILVELYITRIETLDPRINSVVVRTFDAARSQAKQADLALAQGILLGPLHGVPITVKENNLVVGTPSTLGNPSNADHVATVTSPPVQKLLDAGAILLGKTNCPLDLNDVQTYNVIYGRTNNPYDVNRTPGGSSGGSAAALAAGFTALEFGGDIGGSIRTPAHCCGVFGHKATLGAVPAIPLGHGPVRSADIVVKGPLARSAVDLELAMKIVSHLAGPEARALSLSLPECPHTKLREFRVAVWGDDVCCPVDADIQNAIQNVIAVLKNAGCNPVDVNARPPFDSVFGSDDSKHVSRHAFDVYKQLLAAEENQATMSTETKEKMLQDYALRWNSTGASPTLQQDLLQQYKWITQSKQEWQDCDKKRQQMRVAWEDFFQHFDVLICPICASVAWPHDEETETDQPFWKIGTRVIPGANAHRTPYHDQVFWSGLTNVCGNPSTVFPAGRAISLEGKGLPVGLQIVGSEWSDLTTIGFAKALEMEGGFSFQRPV
tara:strand:+ start:33 stop:1598 length:1566 start_codon:yes stop_codon:yes gene_type:complete